MLHRYSSPQLREGISSMQAGGSSKEAGTSVQVALRIRPVTNHDQSSIPSRWQRSVVQPLSSSAVQVDASGQAPPGGIALAPGTNKRHNFTFDRVLGPADGQEQIYNQSVMPLIGRFLEGYNVTILAYGQTSSGKSYTMGTAIGDVDFESLVAGQRPDPQTGIIPRAVAQIFSEMKTNEAARSGAVQYTATASFIEIYNEELIDLLAEGEGDFRPLVQIREDKAGTIIWSGLKEVRVKNVADVMNRLLQGSSIRRTNETDMNAQSSRSHAIFSLTLTQRKYTGGGTPPSNASSRPASSFGMRSSTPTGRASALPRPTSNLPMAASRLTSPIRSNTPGGGTAFGLRPNSVMSTSGRASPIVEERSSDTGEWVTVTSKFHFVDLAGSERLKRTAAQGERIKEGISINSGLHALGNVISALGDPSKSKRTTHVPYRDSKLTRLLQDSLGGNAYTLMIACVSPTEYNVSETLNTLQYANRARNIKNKAEINEVEIGWEDVDYLQGQVLRLRKEMQLVKGFKVGTPGSDAALQAMSQKEVLEWQAKYATLSQKQSQLTAEYTRLQQQSSRENKTPEDYMKAAEPIIIEYEKTVDLLEGTINLQKAALGHLEDVVMAGETRATEQEQQLATMERELEAREETVVELQARLTKLEDREATSDSYARDLESRLATHSVNGVAEASVIAEMRKEISRLRGSDGTREQYIKDLESRLAKSEQAINVLHDQISMLEKEVDRRDEAYKDLQQRMKMLDNTQENKQLVKELDAKDASLMDLQVKLDHLQNERDEIARERGRLTDAAATRQLETGKLADRIRELESKASTVGAGLVGAGAGVTAGFALHNYSQNTRSTMSTVPQDAEEELGLLQTQVEMLTEELNSRQESSNELQDQMQAITVKHKEALAEIQDLTSQLNEARLAVPETPGEYLTPSETPTLSRKGSYNFLSPGSRSRGRPESLLLEKSTARRQSLSRRSSNSFLGYNPKESTVRDGTMTPTSNHNNQAFQQAVADGSPTLFRTQSLSQSLGPGSSTGGKRKLSLSGSADFAKLGFAPQQSSDDGLVSPNPMNYERKIASLEAEALRLQEVLRERDEEIASLERESKKVPNGIVRPVSNGSIVDDNHEASTGLKDEQTGDVDELMRALARKETESRQEIEQLATQVQDHKKEKEALQSMMENQMANMGREIEALRQREAEMAAEMERLRSNSLSASKENDNAIESLQQMHVRNVELLGQQHAQSIDALKVDHDSKLQEAVKIAQAQQIHQHNIILKGMQDDHSSMLTKMQSEDELTLTRAVEAVQQQHLTTLNETEAEGATRQMEEQAKIKQDHARQIEILTDNHTKALEEHRSILSSEHTAAMEAAISGNNAQLDALDEQHQKAIGELSKAHANTQDGHEAVLVSLREQHDQSLAQKSQEHASVLESLQGEHDAKMQSLKTEHETALTQLAEQHCVALSKGQQELQEASLKHTASIQALEAETGDRKRDLEILQQNHLHTLEQLEALKSVHSERLRALTDEHAGRLQELDTSLQEAVSTRNALAVTHEELQSKHSKLLEQDPHDIDALRLELAETSDALVTLEGALTEAQEERDRLLIELQNAKPITKVVAGDAKSALAQSQKEVELLQTSLANVRSELQRSKSDIQGMLEDKTRQESALREMQIKVTIAETRSASQSNRANNSSISPSTSSDFHNGDFIRSSASPFRRESAADQDSSRGASNRSLGPGALSKPPPLTPPPNMPPPPTPSTNGATTPTQQRSSTGLRSSASSSSLLHNRPDSPNGHFTRSSSSTSMNSPNHLNGASTDSKTAKLLHEQTEELQNMAKQLNHCEMDLQANIDLVATLEAALNDSERNLRKSRVQLSEATRERDRYAMQADELRSQVSQAQQEADSVRNSVMLEKQGYENKLQMEREAKEKARRALEARLEEVQKKKNGKLFCM